ncbi:NADPH-dependent aldehyde reductase Ahr [Acaryochloris marina]|uniref:alcohol dehydrogenase (NADP(+)) n=1 Tax=Acaryochloris marina (strain MBIC 11017) TaxID=329726 RepID=B0C2J9_ACAM1|nr:NAD(P)-dependent alcohol dehydrogenase [Acaryochloris marina]ABW29789.1 Zinc-containing alcohol dehydrogenase family protein [Acaryochloris marina MBIC11017]BDM78675.1 aldehyde reductase Ahr [Acaryochloris marina MBIC10699]
MVNAYAAFEQGGVLQPFEYDPGPLGRQQVDIQVEYCGICHSDLSMIKNEWGMTQYPFVPGHEIVGIVAEIGSEVTTLRVGQRVGLGWYSSSCMHCEWCMGGDHHLCLSAEGTIVGRPGGFADQVRADQSWIVPIPESIDSAVAGPLFCAGITVFQPIIQCGVQPTDRVAVIGIGGLGHLALQFLNAWGCEVTALSTQPDKEAEARRLGAHHFVNTRDPAALQAIANSCDYIISTVNVSLEWSIYLNALRPKGRLHLVGVAPDLSLPVFPLLAGQRSISGSPVGSPATITKMLNFVARHGLAPQTEVFPLAQVNEALEKLRSQHPPYRLALKC